MATEALIPLGSLERKRTFGFADFDGIVSWVLGISLIISGIPHLGNPYFFLGSVYAYDLVDPGLGQIVAMTLPFLQVILAACLITRLFHGAAHTIAFFMFLGFATLQTSVTVRCLDIACGCFGPRHDTAIGWYTLSTIYTLLALSLARIIGFWISSKSTRSKLIFR